MKISKSNVAYLLTLFSIFFLAIFFRVYWASNQNTLYWDEYASVWFSNNKIDTWLFDDTMSYTDVLDYNKEYTGKEIKKLYFYDDSSLEGVVNDLSSLYKDSKDSYISNFYYLLLRLSFAFREVHDVKNIIITGTLLNIIFFIISFIFMYKLLKLVFNFDLSKNEHKIILLFSMLCLSIIPSSFSMGIFLRPYQIQETFFIVLTYLVFYVMKNNKYTIKNFVILTILTGLGYLSLYSSIVLTLCISLIIFIYFYKQALKNVDDKLSYTDV